jgi:hypothetical protein
MEREKSNNQNINAGSKPDSLPNARAGHPYRMQIGAAYLPSNPSAVCWFDGLEQTGLHFFPDKKQITGIPKNSGSFDMQLNIREYNEYGMEELSTHSLRLVVENDYDFELGEVDESEPYLKRDDDVYAIPVNQGSRKRLKKDIAAASRRGHQHIEEGKIREDDFYIRYDPETRWYALAVADGAGRSKYSRKGSQIAGYSAVEACLEGLTAQSHGLKKLTIRYSRRKSDKLRREIIKKLHDIIASSVAKAYEDIVAEATDFGCQPEDYAATLLMCICKKFEFGWLIGAFSVGDGAVCVYHTDDWYANLMGGGECPAEKCFLTTPGVTQPAGLERRIRFTIVDDFSALFLMTNGVSDPKFGTEADLPCFELWNRFWDDITSEVNFSGNIKDVGEELLKWFDFWTPGKYDDRTIAVVF